MLRKRPVSEVQCNRSSIENKRRHISDQRQSDEAVNRIYSLKLDINNGQLEEEMNNDRSLSIQLIKEIMETIDLTSEPDKQYSSPSSPSPDDAISIADSIDYDFDPNFAACSLPIQANPDPIASIPFDLHRLNVGDIIWASATGYCYWPALVHENENEPSHVKENMIHVKFLFDGRTQWVNFKNSVMEYNGLDDFHKKRDARKLNKTEKKKWNTKGKRCWELATYEADVLLKIKTSDRVPAYNNILWAAVQAVKKGQKIKGSTGGMTAIVNTGAETPFLRLSSKSIETRDAGYYARQKVERYLQSINEDNESDNTIAEFNPVVESTVIMTRTTDHSNDLLTVFNDLRNQYECRDDELLATLQDFWNRLRANEITVPKRSRLASATSDTDTSGIGTLSNSSQQTIRQRKLSIFKEDKARPRLEQQQNSMVITKKEPNKVVKTDELHVDEWKACLINECPADYLLKNLSKNPVCEYCLNGDGDLYKCGGQCDGYYHLKCMKSAATLQWYESILKSKRNATSDEKVSNAPQKIHEKCVKCMKMESEACLICSKSHDKRLKCSYKNCSNIYHENCLKHWPNPNGNKSDAFICPRHICHTCNAKGLKSSVRNVMKCLLCPATYHRSSECIPAGCQLLSNCQLICTRHSSNLSPKNFPFCSVCSKGGSLNLCDACPQSFHHECIGGISNDDIFHCDECISGRKPLHGELVWVKFGVFAWWPAVTVPTPRIPSNVLKSRKNLFDICVKFFPSKPNNYAWIHSNRVYTFDNTVVTNFFYNRKTSDKHLKAALEEAERALEYDANLLKSSRSSISARNSMSYKKISSNIILAKYDRVDHVDGICSCSLEKPCKLQYCINSFLYVECDPKTCPAKEKCQNQNMQKGPQYAFEVRNTENRGYGLFAKEKIPKRKFIIEYIGEVIDQEEKRTRMAKLSKTGNENYYFLDINGILCIDSSMRGNEGRFINHSCSPNAIAMKWIVNQRWQIGIFAKRDIQPGEEITFDYVYGDKRKKSDESKRSCFCGSQECKGSIW